MVSLNSLTKQYLIKLAEDCNITLKLSMKKPEQIKKIKDAKIPEKKLQQLIKKHYEQYQEGKSRGKAKKESKKKPKSSEIKLEERISLLEEQVKFLMAKIGGVEVVLARKDSPDIIGSTSNLFAIKDIIKSNILPGDSMTIDELIKVNELHKFSLSLLEQAINELIDDEIFDASEGYSIQKIGGNVGLLIRR